MGNSYSQDEEVVAEGADRHLEVHGNGVEAVTAAKVSKLSANNDNKMLNDNSNSSDESASSSPPHTMNTTATPTADDEQIILFDVDDHDEESYDNTNDKVTGREGQSAKSSIEKSDDNDTHLDEYM